MGAIIYSQNETPNFYATLTDGADDQYPRAYVYNYDKTLKETVDLDFNAHGQYIGTAADAYDHNTYSVVYKVFSDSDRTILNTEYCIEEDILTVAYQPTWGNGGGGAGNVFLDVKKIAEEVWAHATPKKILELLEAIKEKVIKIKELVSKISDVKVLKAIKGIVFPKIPAFPKIPPFPKFPEIPKPEKVDLEPLEQSIDDISEELKELKSCVNKIDYGATLSEVVRLLEEKNEMTKKEKLTALKKMLENYES